MIDLHVHSYFSDGSDAPADLVRLSAEAGVSVLALTDHDTGAGLPEAACAAKNYGLRLIPGIELSTSLDGQEYHILGYGQRSDSQLFEEMMRYLAKNRVERNQKLLAKLNESGINIDSSDLQRYAKGQIGRLHFAKVLIANGYVNNVREAFVKYLSYGGRAFIPRLTMSPIEAIKFLKSVGAVCVLAHPHLYDFSLVQLQEFCTALKGEGLAGIEVYYPEHSPEHMANYLKIADEVGLFCTGGSDFHGSNIPGKRLGRAYQGMLIPDICANGLM